jgi:hypothetical protein
MSFYCYLCLHLPTIRMSWQNRIPYLAGPYLNSEGVRLGVVIFVRVAYIYLVRVAA